MLENINFRKTQLNQRYLQFKSDDNNDRKEHDELQAKLSVLDQNVSGIIKELETAEKDLEENQSRNKSIVSGYIIQTKNYQRPDPRWKHSGILQNAMMAMATASVVLWSRKRTIRALLELLLIILRLYYVSAHD